MTTIRALVLDDNPTDRLLLSAYLKEIFILADPAENSKVAEDLLKSESYNILFVDLEMPGYDGYSFIKKIRSQGHNQPIVITSGKRTLKDVKEGIQVGATDYIVKPIDRSVFDSKVKSLLSGQPLNQDWYEYPIPEQFENSPAQLSLNTRLLSVGEVGLSFTSSVALVPGTQVTLTSELMIQNQVGQLMVRVESCQQQGALHILRGSFVGLTETHRRQIRLLCKSLFPKSA